MWKPGTVKPQVQESSTDKRSSPKDAQIHVNGSHTNGTKRLSGMTMNMRFMKRKMEVIENETRRLSNSDGHPSTTSRKRGVSDMDGGTNLARDHEEQPSSSMELCEHDTHDNQEESHYAQATSIDMYGSEGLIMGRRSFGGFNPAMERAWKDSKASSENSFGGTSGSRQKISDEELIKRYQTISQKRGVGSLEDKIKGKSRKRGIS